MSPDEKCARSQRIDAGRTMVRTYAQFPTPRNRTILWAIIHRELQAIASGPRGRFEKAVYQTFVEEIGSSHEDMVAALRDQRTEAWRETLDEISDDEPED